MRPASSLHNLFALAFVLAVATAAGGPAQAAKFKVLLNFGTHKLGSNPMAPVMIDQADNLYTTASRSGPRGGGTAVELKRKAGGYKTKTIFRFDSQNGRGQQPVGSLIIDTAGNLYGVAENLVFELSPVANQITWNETILYRFCSHQNCGDGSGPVGGLTYSGAASGTPYDGVSPLYGVTDSGGANAHGTVFQLTKTGGNWSETVLYNFCSQGGDMCTDGFAAAGGLVVDAVGNLLGTTSHGGEHNLGKNGGGAGVIYQLSTQGGNSWSETVLHNFCSTDECTDGAFPFGTLTLDGAGDLLGTAAAGGGKCRLGKNGCGVIYKLTPAGQASQETVLYSFCRKPDCADGEGPVASPVIDANGNLFGTTENGGGNDIDENGRGGGVIYELSGTSYKVLYHFCSLANCADGEYPQTGLILGASGNLFGTTNGGVDGGGTLFEAR